MTEADVDGRRRRRMARIVTWAAAVGGLLAVGAGIAGAEGRASVAILLLVVAAGSALASAYGLGSSVVDEMRGEHVSRHRIAWMVGLFVATFVLMAMVAGVGG